MVAAKILYKESVPNLFQFLHQRWLLFSLCVPPSRTRFMSLLSDPLRGVDRVASTYIHLERQAFLSIFVLLSISFLLHISTLVLLVFLVHHSLPPCSLRPCILLSPVLCKHLAWLRQMVNLISVMTQNGNGN